MNYKIAQINIAMDSPYLVKENNNFIPFKTEEKATYTVQFVPMDKIESPKGEIVEENTEYLVEKENDRYNRYFYDQDTEHIIYAKTQWDWEKKKVIIEVLEAYRRFFCESGNAFFHIGLEQIMLHENRLIFHAACVDTDYGGILFAGPSGAGKSTQADLWIQYRDAFLINGDRPILSKNDPGWKAWGSPYAGSSKCHVNRSCDIRAIVKVVQDSENRMILLKGAKAFSAVYSGITLNDWSREDVEQASNLVMELINTIPMYELHCTKTMEAVETLEKVLKGEKEI